MICHSFDELIKKGYHDFKGITGIYEKNNGKYIGKTFGEFYSDVRSLSEKLLDMGLRGKTVMIYGKNSYNWMVVYLAIAAYVGIAIPIDKEWKANDVNNILSTLNIDYIFYSGYLGENLKIAGLTKANLEDETTALIFQGHGLAVKREDYEKNSGRICTILFTSGTTSAPKKIELTEKNLFANADDMARLVSLSTNDRYMVSLPLNHIATLLAGFIYPIHMGASLYIPNDFKEMTEDLKLIRPTVLFGVPRIFEKLWDAVPAEKQEKIKKTIKISNLLRKFGIDMRKKIFAELHKNLGGAVRFAYSGSAKLDEKLAHIFDDMGLPILQAYGLTETSAIVSCDSINDYRLCSVGKVLLNQDCKIIEQNRNGVGEICVKGENVAKCAIADDGYLHTGDLGYFDKDGYLFLVERKKRLIKLSNGKNVYPDELEELLLRNKEIQQVFVHEQDGRIVATIVSNCDVDIINNFVDKLNGTLPHYKHIRSVTVTDKLRKKLTV